MKFLLVIATLIIFTAINADAQKLPNIQEGSMPAPAKVSIDGKSNEWGALKAFNKSTSIFYTLGNDKNNLYLVVQAGIPGIIQKIISGGITLAIEDAAKSKSSVPFLATFPLMRRKSQADIYTRMQDTTSFTDNGLTNLNNELEASSPEIKISGNQAIPDSLISVYNDHGIKVSHRLDLARKYTYELSIPLKYISNLISTDGALNYSVKLNGRKSNLMVVTISGGPAGGATFSPPVGGVAVERGNNSGISFMELSTHTSLSGSYTLAK